MERELIQAEAELEQLLRQVDRALGQGGAGGSYGMGESMVQSTPAPHPVVANACAGAANRANAIRAQLGRTRSEATRGRLRAQAVTWLRNTSNGLLPVLGNFSVRDLDLLAGCMTRMEAVAGSTPPELRNLRGAIARRLGMPAGEAELEGEGEVFDWGKDTRTRG
jgi:hypothetical protein